MDLSAKSRGLALLGLYLILLIFPTPPGLAQVNEAFQVHTFKIPKIQEVRDIQLLSPPHNSTLTPGVVKFQWEMHKTSKSKLKMRLIVEKIDTPIKHQIKSKTPKNYLSCGPGSYRWRVEAELGGKKSETSISSHWRTFRVVGLTMRGTASNSLIGTPLNSGARAILRGSGTPQVSRSRSPSPMPVHLPMLLHRKRIPLQPMAEFE